MQRGVQLIDYRSVGVPPQKPQVYSINLTPTKQVW